MRTILRVLPAVLLLGACFRNPVTGKNQLSLLSEKQEIELGNQSAREVAQSVGLYKDEALQKYVNDLGQAMARKSERPNLPWTFQVVDDASVNAFALPGGKIFITRGLFAHVNTDAELVSVIGHEIGHVTARHSAQQLTKGQLAQAGLGLGSVVSPKVAEYAQAAGAGIQLLFLKFGRDDERQADDLGFKYSIGAGYDARAMASMFETLQRVSESAEGGKGRLPGWLSTHPDPEERVAATQKRVAAAQGTVAFAELKNAREPVLAHLKGMVFGEDPRNGFFQGSTFFHPGLKVALDLPPGWKYQNTAEAVAAASPQGDAAVQFSLTSAKTPAEAAKAVLGQEGIQAGQTTEAASPPSVSAPFQAKTEQGAVEGLARFVSIGDRVYQLLGYAKAGQLTQHETSMKQFLGGVRSVSETAIPKVEPARITLLESPRSTTLSQLATTHPSSVPLRSLAVLNGVETQASVPASRIVKWVVGGPPANVATGGSGQ